MKNKKIIWILLPGVLLIWGLIFFQVKKAVSSSSQPLTGLPIQQSIVDKRADTSYYQLKLNYKDPFLKNSKPIVKSKVKTVSARPKRAKPKVMRKVTKAPVKWPTITYKGLINNKKGNRAIYLIELDGVSLFMSPGEERSKLKLLKVFRDSVQISYMEEKQRTFKKQ